MDNAVDEYIMGFGKRIDIRIGEDGLCRVRDWGRGIRWARWWSACP